MGGMNRPVPCGSFIQPCHLLIPAEPGLMSHLVLGGSSVRLSLLVSVAHALQSDVRRKTRGNGTSGFFMGRSTPCRRCLRSQDYWCCCEADCCFPDCRSSSARSAPPTLRLPAIAFLGLSSCFTSFRSQDRNCACKMSVTTSR